MRKKFSRRVFLKAGFWAAGLGIGGHLLARHALGPSYPKRIPLVRRVYADKRASFDFFFGTHEKPGDAAWIEAQIEKAEKGGKPYNVIVIENSAVIKGKRKEYEDLYNKTAIPFLKKTYSGLGQARKENEMARKTLKALEEGNWIKKLEALKGSREARQYLNAIANTEKIIEEREGQIRQNENAIKEYRESGFIEALVDLAARQNLYVKFAEEHAPEEMRKRKGLEETAKKHFEEYAAKKDPNQFRLSIKAEAEALFQRDKTIAKTIEQAKREISGMPEFKGKKIRALVSLGAAHQNAARNFDRLSRSSVKAFKNIEVDPYYQEVIRLSRKGPRAIKRY